jgi:predicted nucleic acid-binding Zn ribbon protein
MPIHEYAAHDPEHACDYCREDFECVEELNALAMSRCPKCRAPVVRQLSAARIGRSESGLHDRAKQAGFTTYKKTGKGEYEKKY